MTMRETRRKNQIGTVQRGPSLLCAAAMALLVMLLLTACAAKKTDQKAEELIEVDTQAEAQKVLKLEDERAITPANVQGDKDFSLVGGEAIRNVPAYRMGPGDVLEVVYHIKYQQTKEAYRLDVQDRISVHFPYHPQFSTSALVRGDGKISMPLIDELDVAGLTIEELTKLLNKRYSKFIKNPSITVGLEQFNVRVDELKRAITTAPRGQSKIAPITPDGQVGFPIIGNVKAAGLTVAQLEKLINERYAGFIEDLNVTLILLEIHNNKVYVYGEVPTPGMFELQERLDVAQAIGRAGGFKDSADLSEVMIIRNNGQSKPMAYRVDVERMLDEGMVYAGLYLQPSDIVYVPKTGLDRANDYIAKVFTKGLYSVVPFTSSFTVNYDLTPVYRLQ